jgi:CarboxypepD_reg-like domain
MKLMKFVLFFFFLSAAQSWAQVTVKGVIKSGKGSKPIKAVNVSLKDTYDGTITDSIGRYSFTTTEKGEMTLVVEANGYMPEERKINLNQEVVEVNFLLRKMINELEAVTITAGSFEANDKKRSTVLILPELYKPYPEPSAWAKAKDCLFGVAQQKKAKSSSMERWSTTFSLVPFRELHNVGAFHHFCLTVPHSALEAIVLSTDKL